MKKPLLIPCAQHQGLEWLLEPPEREASVLISSYTLSRPEGECEGLSHQWDGKVQRKRIAPPTPKARFTICLP